jgi:hypothetical protein
MTTIKREKIIRNMIECPVCHDVIESVHRHDFKYCSCGNVSVDGGQEYRKRSWGNGGLPIERSEVIEEDYVLPDYAVDISKEYESEFDNFRADILKKCEEKSEITLHKKKTKLGMVTFVHGHINKDTFVTAYNAKTKKPIVADDVYHMYSDVERGRYGAGRRFWIKKEPKSEPVTVFMESTVLRNRMKKTVA